jgi:hypothetical protein
MANGPNEEAKQAERNAEAQRRVAAQAQANQQGLQGQNGQQGQRDVAALKAEADKRNRELLDREVEERANRPQGVGGKPTPTQIENDEFRLGLRGVDDKEDDGSGPDLGSLIDENRLRFNEERRRRSIEAEKAGGQQTR